MRNPVITLNSIPPEEIGEMVAAHLEESRLRLSAERLQEIYEYVRQKVEAELEDL